MGAQGFTTISLGAFPGTSDGSAVITGQAGIISGSLVEAWISLAAATADHSPDEHMVERIRVYAGNIVAGTGFTVYLVDDNQLTETAPRGVNNTGTNGPRIYGDWRINWVWN